MPRLPRAYKNIYALSLDFLYNFMSKSRLTCKQFLVYCCLFELAYKFLTVKNAAEHNDPGAIQRVRYC